MSFILDALKKSELERQRQSVPGLIDARLSPKRRPLPLWAVGLGVLLAINLLGLTFVLYLILRRLRVDEPLRAPDPLNVALVQNPLSLP